MTSSDDRIDEDDELENLDEFELGDDQQASKNNMSKMDKEQEEGDDWGDFDFNEEAELDQFLSNFLKNFCRCNQLFFIILLPLIILSL